MISIAKLEKFKEIFQAQFRESLNDNDALIKATVLLNMYEAVHDDEIKAVDNK